MLAFRTALQSVALLAVLMAASGTGVSQNGTAGAQPERPRGEQAIPNVPGITVERPPPARRAAPRRPGEPEAEQDQPADSPGCRYRENKLELIV